MTRGHLAPSFDVGVNLGSWGDLAQRLAGSWTREAKRMLATSEDHVAITGLLARYCLTLDPGYVEGWLALVLPEARYEVYGRSFDGYAALRAMIQAAPGGLHLGGPPAIEMIDRDRARTRRNLLFLDRPSDASRSAIYTNELQRTEGGWWIARCRRRFLVRDGPSGPVAIQQGCSGKSDTFDTLRAREGGLR